jgi:hypothetical protein
MEIFLIYFGIYPNLLSLFRIRLVDTKLQLPYGKRNSY